MSYYSANPHYAPDDFSEDRERLERCQAEAGRLFANLTKPQLAQFHETMNAIRPYSGSPRWEREKKAADFIWQKTTADANRIYEMALRDLMRDGEISEATYFACDEVTIMQTMAEPALQAAE